MRQVIAESQAAYQSMFAGQVKEVLWEKARKLDGIWQVEGLTDNYLRVQAAAPQNLRNTISTVKLLGNLEKMIIGEIVG